MTTPTDAMLLRIFVGENDKADGRPLHEVLVEEAQRAGLAGATVLRGVLGYGAHSRIHSAKVLRLSEDLPMVVEIVDAEDRIEAFIPRCEHLIREGLVTLERVRVIVRRAT